MSQTYENCIQLSCVHCVDIGLDCNCTIYGISEKKAIDNTIVHMFEYHAIKPEEMTTCMRLKIKENMHIAHTPPPLSQLVYNNQF
jgi:predicted small metal-binding protein